MKRVLWVEDDGRIRKAAERLCKANGVEAEFVAYGVEAIFNLAFAFRYLAVVSDFDLGPGFSGADILAAAERAGIPIRLLCSGGTHGADCPEATVIYDKMGMREMVEDVLAPLFKGDNKEGTK